MMWNRFWFAPAPTHLLAFVRIFFSLWLILKRTGLWGLHRFPDWNFRFPVHAVKRTSQYPMAGFRDPVPGFEWIPSPSLATYQSVETATLLLAILYLVGLGTRVVGPLLTLGFGYLFVLSQFSYVHHNHLFLAVFLILAFSRCGDHYSLDALMVPGPRPDRPVTPIRMLQVLTSALYASTTFGKLNEGWFDGRVMELLHDGGHFRGGASAWVYAHTGPLVLSHFTLFAEGILAFGLWLPQIRPLAVFSGFSLHAGIDMLMPVTTFSYQVTSLYLVFLDPRPHRTIVRYDRRSGFQRGAATVGGALNWLARVRWEGHDGVLTTETPWGDAITGYRAWIEAGLRLPMTFPIAFVFGLPFTLRGRRRA